MLSVMSIFFHTAPPQEIPESVKQVEGDVVIVKGLATLPHTKESRVPKRRDIWEPPGTEDITAESYVIMDSRTGEILYSRSPNKIWPAASITKLMTAIISHDALEEDNVQLTDEIIITSKDDAEGTRYIYEGESVEIQDIYRAMLIGSINSFAQTLMRASEKEQEEFINRMNEKARRFGLWNTHFDDVTGLSEGNTITAKEGAWLLKEALEYPIIQDALLRSEYTFETKNTRRSISIKNTNILLESGYRIEGGKTGHIEVAKYNFAVRIGNNLGDSILIVVLGSDTEETRFSDTSDLAEWTFTNYEWQPL
jgi:D-alanyl-D-alanine carboxypeptidase (penicillin-binding protein 5/6)